MSANCLLDTNVIIYLLDKSHPDKFHRSKQLIQDGLQKSHCCISQQVVQETLNLAIQKLHFSSNDALKLLQNILLPMCRVIPQDRLYQTGIYVQSRFQFSFYDSLIVAGALEAGCKTLYTEDLQHGQKIEQLTIKNPFLG